MPADAHAALPVAGWYHDPQDPGQLRYWDGQLWTSHYHPVAEEAPLGEPRRLRPFAIAAIAGLVIAFFAHLASLVVDLSARDVIGGILAGEQISFAEIAKVEEQLQDTNAGLAIGFLIAAATFLPWFFQAHANLRRRHVNGVRHGSGWAVGAWFIPVFNLVRPKQIANDIYRGSQPEARSGGLAAGRVAPLVHWWWAVLLLGAVATRGGAAMVNVTMNETVSNAVQAEALLDQEHMGWSLLAGGHVLTSIAAILAIMLVARVTAAQDGGAEHPQAVVAPAARPSPSVTTISANRPSDGSQSPPGWVDPYR